MKRYFTELAYDGTNYHGWQVQPNAVTVQEVLQNAFSTILRRKIMLTGCGRTDTGVHAAQFIAHFDVKSEIKDPEKLAFRLNGLLPEDIVIRRIYRVDNDLHARFSAISREYVYKLTRSKPLFNRGYILYYYGELNIDLMNNAAEILKLYEDFTSFSKLHTDVKTNNCKIQFANWSVEDNEYHFTIRADRFLRNMVRSIVGTMLEVGQHKVDLDEFRTIIEAKDRGKAGTSAPAKGLYLSRVMYPE